MSGSSQVAITTTNTTVNSGAGADYINVAQAISAGFSTAAGSDSIYFAGKVTNTTISGASDVDTVSLSGAADDLVLATFTSGKASAVEMTPFASQVQVLVELSIPVLATTVFRSEEYSKRQRLVLTPVQTPSALPLAVHL